LLAGNATTIESLGQAFANLKVTENPYFISLMKGKFRKKQRELDKIRLNHKTWCHDQMKKLLPNGFGNL